MNTDYAESEGLLDLVKDLQQEEEEAEFALQASTKELWEKAFPEVANASQGGAVNLQMDGDRTILWYLCQRLDNLESRLAIQTRFLTKVICRVASRPD